MLTVAIVGKPNVGKSTLFNRIIGVNKAIVDSSPGVTRDRIEAYGQWLTQTFKIIDTGGLMLDEFDFKKQVELQVNYAIDKADAIIFLVSFQEGINQDDFYVSKLLKKYKSKKVFITVNKSENRDPINDSELEYLKFGFQSPYFISSTHGIGIGDLLDAIVKTPTNAKEKDNSFKFCIIGKPNVGKSSLVNAILNEERMITSNIANTTRDAVDSYFKRNQKEYTIIDTAGIRRKGKIQQGVDKYSYLRVNQSISRSNLIVVLLDGSTDFDEQDETIAGLAYKANIPTIIAVNKWDIVADKDEKTMNKLLKIIKIKFNFLSWAPIVFLSAKENKRINTLFDQIQNIRAILEKKYNSKILSELVWKLQMLNTPPLFNRGRIKINHVTQVYGQIPTFVLFCNNPQYLHFSYARYLENEMRKSLGLTNVPITLFFKSKTSNTRNNSES
ncbi:MAG: ribosome biogenesis GTPase Der [Malacoplasma sp.]|mgnify:CR=1 FL=1|nr:ribosome biogenesis GTPase Der [Malacoplasma sp.]